MLSVSRLVLFVSGLPPVLAGATAYFDATKVGFGDVPATVQHVLAFSWISLGGLYLLSAIQSKRTRHQTLLLAMLFRLPASWVMFNEGPAARGSWGFDTAIALIGFGAVLLEGGGLRSIGL